MLEYDQDLAQESTRGAARASLEGPTSRSTASILNATRYSIYDQYIFTVNCSTLMLFVMYRCNHQSQVAASLDFVSKLCHFVRGLDQLLHTAHQQRIRQLRKIQQLRRHSEASAALHRSWQLKQEQEEEQQRQRQLERQQAAKAKQQHEQLIEVSMQTSTLQPFALIVKGIDSMLLIKTPAKAGSALLLVFLGCSCACSGEHRAATALDAGCYCSLQLWLPCQYLQA